MICPHCGKEIVFKSDVGGAEKAIQLYYRRRAGGARRVTLKIIADQTGFNYDYLRKVKRRYDAAGKWGSKKHDR